MIKHLLRSVAAIAAAFACLALMANPTSANQFHDIDLTGGTFTAIGTGGTTFTTAIGGATGTDCDTTITVDVGTHTGPATITAVSGRFHFILNNVHYIAVVTRTGATAGTISGGTITGVGVSIRIEVFIANDQTSTNLGCEATNQGTRRCGLNTTFSFSGTYTNTSTSIVASNTATLSAPSGTITITPPCVVPFTSFLGGTATFSGLTAHVAT